jgi:hypothetical protein
MNNSKINSYKGLRYKELQKDNHNKQVDLPKDDCNWLRVNGYRNVGWDNVIALSDKIQSLQESKEWSLEDLFLEADRVGKKYQEPEEIQAFQVAMAAEAEQISGIIDQLFPDNEPEIIDFSHNGFPKIRQKSKQQKTYYTN